jgi:hypothetical protein
VSEPLLEVVYVWQDGTEEVRYRRAVGSREGEEVIREVERLQQIWGNQCPYYIRYCQ